MKKEDLDNILALQAVDAEIDKIKASKQRMPENIEEVENMLQMIRTLREQNGITCIIIEHNLKAVMGLCDRIAVLNFGIKIADGRPSEIVENPAVIEAYLGTEEDVA